MVEKAACRSLKCFGGWLLFAVGVAFGTDGAVRAAPSGLNVIPTADILPIGEISLEGEFTGERPLPSIAGEFALESQVGITPRLEAGIDLALGTGSLGQYPLLNAKWLLLPESRRVPAVALGVQNITLEQSPQPYLILTRTLGKTRLHAGAIYISPSTVGMAGIDHLLSKRLLFQADYTGGEVEGFISAGFVSELLPRVALNYALTVPSEGGAVGSILNLSYVMHL